MISKMKVKIKLKSKMVNDFKYCTNEILKLILLHEKSSIELYIHLCYEL